MALARAYGFRVAVALLLPRSTSAVRLEGQGYYEAIRQGMFTLMEGLRIAA